MGFIGKVKRGLVGETIYYPGCFIQHCLPQIQKNYEKILKDLGVSFSVFGRKDCCCGLPALNAGYLEDFTSLLDKNEKNFSSVNKIITSCPSCFRTFKEEYSFGAEHVVETIAKNLKKIRAKFSEKITFHDSCDLSRHCKLHEEPRKILKALGFEIVELPKSRESAECCGACGGLKENAPKVANLVAQNILNQVQTKKLVTACPRCYTHLKENAKYVEVLELSEVLVND